MAGAIICMWFKRVPKGPGVGSLVPRVARRKLVKYLEGGTSKGMVQSLGALPSEQIKVVLVDKE